MLTIFKIIQLSCDIISAASTIHYNTIHTLTIVVLLELEATTKLRVSSKLAFTLGCVACILYLAPLMRLSLRMSDPATNEYCLSIPPVITCTLLIFIPVCGNNILEETFKPHASHLTWQCSWPS